MHILFLSDNFPPEVNEPASRAFEHCREWVKAGHKVTVITCAPNFPQGKVYSGYRNRLWQRETMDGIGVIRVWSYITANQGFARRTLDYLSYMITGFLCSLCVRKVDLVIGTSPQFFTVCAAYVTSMFKRIPFIFELRDLWPDSIKALGAMRESCVIRFFEKVEAFLYRKAASIVCVTESFRTVLVERDVPWEKIRVVTNGVDIQRFQPMKKDPGLVKHYSLEGMCVAGYIGTHGMAHALETILKAADKIRKTKEGKKIRFILLGDGAEKHRLVKSAESMELDNVIFIDSVPKEEVARYWSLLDVSIIHLKKNELFTTVIPSKLFESMGMGIPILHGVAGESAEIVTAEKVGLTFEPENVDELCEKLLMLKNDPDLYLRLMTRCIEAAKHYDRKALATKMLNILEQYESAEGFPATSGKKIPSK